MSDFNAFFEAHYTPIVRSLTAAFGDQSAVDEAVQDAFVKAFARWRRVQRYEAPAAWVRRVAINRLRDQHRSQQRRRRAEERAWEESQVQSTELRSRAGPVVAMIDQLPPRQRLAMALYYVEDLSVREIASSMSLSEGAVKAHLSQGRASIARTASQVETSSDSVDD